MSNDPRKLFDLNIAGRATFEAWRAGSPGYEHVTWDSLPEKARRGTPWAGKGYWRREVQIAVEALWRAGRLR